MVKQLLGLLIIAVLGKEGGFKKPKKMCTYPHFSKVCFIPLHRYKRPTFIPVLTNQKKSEEDFCSWGKKRRKAKTASSGGLHPSRERGPPPPAPRTTRGISASGPGALSCVPEHLGSISTDSVCPLARHVLGIRKAREK